MGNYSMGYLFLVVFITEAGPRSLTPRLFMEVYRRSHVTVSAMGYRAALLLDVPRATTGYVTRKRSFPMSSSHARALPAVSALRHMGLHPLRDLPGLQPPYLF